MDRPLGMAAVAPELPLEPKQRNALALAQRAARDVLQRRFRLLALLRDAYAKLNQHESALGRARSDLLVLLRLARAWATRQYRTIPWKSIVYAVAAIIYFINPADVIPDFLVGIGFVDDAAVITAVVRSLYNDIEAFKRWESGQYELPPARP